MKYWRCLARGSALGRIGAADCGLRLKPGTLRLGGWSLLEGGNSKYKQQVPDTCTWRCLDRHGGQILAWQVPGRDLVGDSCAGPAANQHARQGT